MSPDAYSLFRSLSRRGLAACALIAVTACGTYVEPKPGIHRAVGELDPDLMCEYAAPTAMRIVTWRCRRTDTMAAEERIAKESLENARLVQLRDP